MVLLVLVLLVLTTECHSGDQTRRIRWAGHVPRIWREEVHTGFWWGNLRERDHLEDPCIDGRIILDGSSRSGMWGGMDWIDLA